MPTSIGYRAAEQGRPGTTDPNFMRRQALSQQLIGQSLQARPAYSWGEALARALTPVAQTWGAKDDQNTAMARDKSFQSDYGAATKQWSDQGADPQALSQILAGSTNPDLAALAPGQVVQDAAWKREQNARNEDRTWRTAESDKDRAIRQQQHEEQLALQRQAAARAGQGTFGQPIEVMVDGKPTLIRMSSRGGPPVDAMTGQPVRGQVSMPPPGGEPPFAGKNVDSSAYNLLAQGQKDPAIRATPEYAIAWNKVYGERDIYDQNSGTRTRLTPSIPPGIEGPGMAPRPTPQAQAPQMTPDGGFGMALPPAQTAAPPAPSTIAAPGGVTQTRVGPGRPLTSKDREDLAEHGATVTTFDRLQGNFKDSFGGYGSDTVGEIHQGIKRKVTGDATGSAQWWQDYQEQKNSARHKLFGGALTATEKGEFEKAIVTIGMRPEQIRENLARQASAARRAAGKIAKSMEADGYNRKAIEEAIGMSLDQISSGAGSGGAAEPDWIVEGGQVIRNPKKGAR